MSQSFFSAFYKKVQLTEDIFSFYFYHPQTYNKKEVPNWHYLPGQYIRMTLPHNNPDNRGTSRFFSIASSPTQKEFLVFTIKIIESTFKKRLMDLKKNDPVQFWGPIGQFVLPEETKKSLVFISGGMGITPFYSMISYAFHKELQIRITLLASFSSVKDVIYFEEMQNISKQYPNIASIYTVTNESNQWGGEKGRISEKLIRTYIHNIHESLFFIAGPTNMVTDMGFLLGSIGINDLSIINESFPGY